MTNPIDTSIINMYNTYAGNYSSMLPLSGTTTASENLIPAAPYNPIVPDTLHHQKTTAMKSDSTLTHNNNNNVPVSRKRSRETINNNYDPFPSHKNCGTLSFLGHDISQHIHHHHLDIDNLISQHVSKIKIH